MSRSCLTLVTKVYSEMKLTDVVRKQMSNNKYSENANFTILCVVTTSLMLDFSGHCKSLKNLLLRCENRKQNIFYYFCFSKLFFVFISSQLSSVQGVTDHADLLSWDNTLFLHTNTCKIKLLVVHFLVCFWLAFCFVFIFPSEQVFTKYFYWTKCLSWMV